MQSKLAIFSFFLLLLFPKASRGEELPFFSLKGLKAVSVNINPQGDLEGVKKPSNEALRKKIVTRLTKAGITVLPEGQYPRLNFMPFGWLDSDGKTIHQTNMVQLLEEVQAPNRSGGAVRMKTVTWQLIGISEFAPSEYSKKLTDLADSVADEMLKSAQ